MAKIHTPVPALKLNDGTSIPMLAYGTGTAWSKKSAAEDDIDRDLVEGIKSAIGMGYRHFDCAESYRNECDLGVALKESKVDRKDFYVTTKVMTSTSDIYAAAQTSLKKLQLDYVDLYLIHAPYFADEGENVQKLQDAWAVLEKIKADGLAKSIGVSNYLPVHLDAVLATAKVPPAINQVELHPYLQRTELTKYCKKHSIAVSAYGPLAPVTKAAGGPLDEFLGQLAKKYAVSPAEILLRWAIDSDIVAITTSGKEQRLSDYLRATKFKLTPEEIRQIREIGEQHHHRQFWGKKFDENDRS